MLISVYKVEILKIKGAMLYTTKVQATPLRMFDALIKKDVKMQCLMLCYAFKLLFLLENLIFLSNFGNMTIAYYVTFFFRLCKKCSLLCDLCVCFV